MATATKRGTSEKSSSKKSSAKKGATKKSTAKRSSTKRAATKKGAAKKAPAKKNKLGVSNSLANNINAHKKRGDSKPKKKSTVAGKQYKKMENNWGKGNK